MSRAGYSDEYDFENWDLIRYRGAVASAIRGKRGQSFLKEMLKAFDELPEKKLIKEELVTEDGCVCAIGAVYKARGVDVENLDPYDTETVAAKAGIADALAREIVFENDEGGSRRETPEERYQRMRRWVMVLLKKEETANG